MGKTEAALYLADHWLQRGHGRGMYIAMPTQATSNQMFERVLTFLERRFPDSLVNVHLLHGQSQWVEAAQQIRLREIAEGEQHTVAAMSWFLPRKRSLLAPFAVGTIDQALMSILLTSHFFVRLFGLSHKVVIFDEVHAYDTYMSVLFRRLLAWLKELNVSVIILSATLPEKTRQELVASYTGSPLDQSLGEGDAYPCLTLCDSSRERVMALPAPPPRTIDLEWIPRAPKEIAVHLARELDSGGCAVVICNTVGRAQEVYQAVEQADVAALLLFHARYPFVWRQEIEQQVLRAFGREGDRPGRAVLIATQVVEQSLDLDFDVMITDPAPVDLVLQRAGRLHRHFRFYRPPRLAHPRLLLTTPEKLDDVPMFGSDEYVYDQYILLASTLVLESQANIVLPDDTRPLIEAVYGSSDWISDLPEPLPAVLYDAFARMQDKWRRDEDQALQRVVLGPDDELLLSQHNEELEEEDPEVHQAFQALTRLIEPGVSVVCLHSSSEGITLEPDGTGPVDLDSPITRELERQFLQRSLTIQHPGVRSALTQLEPPASWANSPALRHHRLALFSDGVFDVPGTSFVLRLTRRLGLEVIKA
ncbi:MAG TPA: CRISPR-associated helicase Cas3' [Aggregatilineaceae bacterium]|nr:CRISPR-associated helicase Cas3' [Aggregatilineaceae bacterium]